MILKNLKAEKTGTLTNGITMWRIVRTDNGVVINDHMARGSSETPEGVLEYFAGFLQSKSCSSDINVMSYYKNTLQGCRA
jgi:hypothetical protein